jgi:hypothetical protein
MLHAFLLLAAEVAEEAETSKTPFYVAGGVFAIWAVLLGVIGLRRPDFPGKPSAARGVMAISALLAVASMATAMLTS